MTLSNGGLTVQATIAASYHTIRGTIGQTTGKFYFELVCGPADLPNGNLLFGVANAGFALGAGIALGDRPISAGAQPSVSGANYFSGGGFVSNYAVSGAYPTANRVYSFAVDFAVGAVWVAVNNVWVNSSNPATGSSPMFNFTPATAGALFPAISLYDPSGGPWTLQSASTNLKYLPPPGFQAWDGGPVTPAASSVWSAADAAANAMTLSNGGLTVTSTVSGAYKSVRGSIGNSSGKVYVEFLANAVMAVGYDMFGAASSSI